MLYKVTGADVNTAEDRVVTISAESKEDAIARARRVGILASNVTQDIGLLEVPIMLFRFTVRVLVILAGLTGVWVAATVHHKNIELIGGGCLFLLSIIAWRSLPPIFQVEIKEQPQKK
ncbi:MAG: hypothetical protein JW719_06695 [Pirellulales bacterium]|nr:hypothetical protein [Pirellulales bacterium]